MAHAVFTLAINQKGKTWLVTYNADLELTNFLILSKRYSLRLCSVWITISTATGWVDMVNDSWLKCSNSWE